MKLVGLEQVDAGTWERDSDSPQTWIVRVSHPTEGARG